MQIGKAKAEARIEALREGGVEVDVWLNSANADTALDEDETSEGTGTATGATKVLPRFYCTKPALTDAMQYNCKLI